MGSAFRGNAVNAAPAAPRARAAGPIMSIKELRDRVGSVKNTKKITSAMKLVAAAKVRRAQAAVLKTRPFSETLQKVLGGLIVRLKKDNFDSPLMQDRPVKKVLLVGITGDRGLCGGYNTYAIKKIETRAAELKAQGIDFDMICIGNKGNTYLRKRYNVIGNYAIGNAPTADEPTGIEAADDEIFMMTSKDGDFSVETTSADKVEPAKFPKDMIFEQDPEQIPSAILPLYFNGQILRQMQESVASELAARMT